MFDNKKIGNNFLFLKMKNSFLILKIKNKVFSDNFFSYLELF